MKQCDSRRYVQFWFLSQDWEHVDVDHHVEMEPQREQYHKPQYTVIARFGLQYWPRLVERNQESRDVLSKVGRASHQLHAGVIIFPKRSYLNRRLFTVIPQNVTLDNCFPRLPDFVEVAARGRTRRPAVAYVFVEVVARVQGLAPKGDGVLKGWKERMLTSGVPWLGLGSVEVSPNEEDGDQYSHAD